MKSLQVKLQFGEPGYIEHPYTIAMHRLVEIKKISGLSRVRSEKKAREALESYLKKMDMTLADYQALEREATMQFHTSESGDIIIPAEKVLSCLVNANDLAPSRMRVQNIRNAIRCSAFSTGKSKADGLWERFVVVTGGSAMKRLSNQRGYRANEYIKSFTASGTLCVDDGMVKPDAVIELLRFAGSNVGIGASRKMGWGRFEVIC